MAKKEKKEKKGKGFFKEFKEFISRGNVLDMAVALQQRVKAHHQLDSGGDYRRGRT